MSLVEIPRRFDCNLLVFIRRWCRLDDGCLIYRSSDYRRCDWLFCDVPECFLMVGIHASDRSMPQSLLMLLGCSLIWMASLTLRVCQCTSWSMYLTSFQLRLCPVLWACSATAEVSVRANLTSLWCSFSLSFTGLPVSPMYTLSHSPHGIL